MWCNRFNNIKAANIHDFASQVDYKMQFETNVRTWCNPFNNIKLRTHMILLLKLIIRCILNFESNLLRTLICIGQKKTK
jgi:hypothetical protein